MFSNINPYSQFYHSNASEFDQPQSSDLYTHMSNTQQQPASEEPHVLGNGQAGQAVYFAAGPYEGRTIRMELHEIQKADLGRKYARVDRRPLDPPPVVHLKMFEVHDAGTPRQIEKELSYDDVQVLGLLCTVDLFPVPDPESIVSGKSSTDRLPYRHRKTESTSSVTQQRSPISSNSGSPSSSLTPSSPTRSPTLYHRRSDSYGVPGCGTREPQPHHFSGYILPNDADSDIVHYVNEFPITEKSKQTQALVGATFVQPVLMDYQGKKAIIFAFSDLAVKIEGYFIMRYRAFDIFAGPFDNNNILSISAECYGGIFRVYSTKEFPGLSASTELTKKLSLYGVRLNIRVTERRRRKRRLPEEDDKSLTPEED